MGTDDRLRAEVAAELKRHARIRNSEIGAIVKDRAVTLIGMVATLDEKMCAERVVRSIKGVRAVANDVEVQLPHDLRRADEHVAEQVGRLLGWYSSLRNMNLKAEVDDGHVTLTGEVDFLYQKQLAAERVGELDGVRRVSNRISVRQGPRIDERELEQQIDAALRRHAHVEAAGIRLSAAQGTVTIDGTVDTYRERDLVEDAVRSSHGVLAIVNNLRVQ